MTDETPVDETPADDTPAQETPAAAPAADAPLPPPPPMGASVPPPPPAGAPVPAARAKVVWAQRTKLVVIIGAALLALGSVLPWAKAEVSFLGQSASETTNGLDGDGVLTLILAVAALAIFFFVPKQKVAGGLVLAAGLLAGAIALYDIVDVNRALDDLDIPSTMEADATVGIGLWLAAVAAVVVIVGGVLCLTQKDDAPAA